MDAEADGGGHEVLRLWTRPERGGPVAAHEALQLVEGRGVEGDHSFGGQRHVTIVFADDWQAAVDALGRPVDPSARRANVLVSGGGGPALVGRILRLGPARVEILGVVDPCAVMDRAAAGLSVALQPDGRAGIWGRVLTGGAVTTGQRLRVDG